MRRGLLILLGLLAVTWFEFQVYPGHSYLQGETQLLVPMLERLDTPGFLSRDLVASHPTFAYTIYDELTQSLHAAGGLSFEQALLAQQVVFRFAAVIGIFLLARGMKVSSWASLLLSGSVNAITHLSAPEAFVTNPEPTPAAFSLSLVFLAAGLLVSRNPLLAGLAGGLALLYDPVTATAFWLVIAVTWLCDRSLRSFLRPAWPSLAIFALVLGNLVQLQAGLGAGQELTARMSAAMLQLIRIRTPWVWASDWVWTGMLTYYFLLVAAAMALTFVWTRVDRIAKWTLGGLAVSGSLSVGVTLLLLSQHAQFAAEMTPSRNLVFSVAVPVLLCGIGSWYAAREGKWVYSSLFMAVLVAAILNSQVLDLLHGNIDVVRSPAPRPAIQKLARWASQNTWGSSLFQFPDAGKTNAPGVFRALSKRALWADWQSGLIADYSEEAGQEWWARWQQPQAPGSLLKLPIDYYVLDRAHTLDGVKRAYVNSDYVVYDAQDLRDARRLFQ